MNQILSINLISELLINKYSFDLCTVPKTKYVQHKVSEKLTVNVQHMIFLMVNMEEILFLIIQIA